MYIVACAVASSDGLANVRVETIMDPVSFLTKVFPTLPEASKAMEEHCNLIVETVIKDHAMQCEQYPQLEKIPDEQLAHWRHKYLSIFEFENLVLQDRGEKSVTQVTIECK